MAIASSSGIPTSSIRDLDRAKPGDLSAKSWLDSERRDEGAMGARGSDMTKLISAISLCVLLGGCMTAEQQEEQAAAQHAAATCAGFGYAPGSPQMAQCQQQVYRENLHYSAEQAAAPQSAVQGFISTVREAGAAVSGNQ
jgi:hypothetical protein